MADWDNDEHLYDKNDGRPSVGRWDQDVLLERLCRYHPDLMPAELEARFWAARRPPPHLAAADLPLHPA